MAMLVLYFLTLLCTMSPLLHATSHNGVCSEGSYCPAGFDCNNNTSLCKAGSCMPTAEDSCVEDISVAFGNPFYDFDESSGTAELSLTLDGPIDCCTVSITVKVDDITAEGGEDYEISHHRFIFVKFVAGQTIASINVNIIDDKYIEESETFRVSIYELSVPYGVILGFYTSTVVTIRDNDRTTLSFSKPTFQVKESDGPAQIGLSLSVPAPDSFTVQIFSQNNNLSVECDQFRATPYDVNFPNGTTLATFLINIINDDIYEENETFTLDILNSFPSFVVLGDPSTATVVIQEDEDPIVAKFEEDTYTIQEPGGSIEPKIMLSKPSPCCFILRAHLMEVSAEGEGVDYGYSPPKIYNYTFHAGSICASPDESIPIINDVIRESVEEFEISIDSFALPFGVVPQGPARIAIIDNDNIASFEFETYTVPEDQSRLYVKIILGEPAKDDRIIPVYTRGINATGGVDYTSGPYNVSFRRDQQESYFYLSITDDVTYEGDECFYISFGSLPHGVVSGDRSTAKVIIQDDEYEVCFKSDPQVEEGSRIQLFLTLSRPLPSSIIVRLEYFDLTAKARSDYYASTTFARFSAGTTETSFYIGTREDSILEEQCEDFIVHVKYASKPGSTTCDNATVTIKDDDDITIKFESSQYSSRESSSVKPRLVLSKTPPFTFSVRVEEEDDTAEGGEDFIVPPLTTVTFTSGGNRFYQLQTEFIDDDLVEDDECYFLKIEPITLPDRVVAVSPNTTKVCILNDDVCIITRVGSQLIFSKPIVYDCWVATRYYTGDPGTITKKLSAGSTTITVDTSRSIQRITISADSRLDRNDFSIRAFRTYLDFY